MSRGKPTLTDRSRAISVSSHAGKGSGVGIGLETCVCSNETPLLFVQTGVAQDLTCARSTMEPNQNATGARIVILTECQTSVSLCYDFARESAETIGVTRDQTSGLRDADLNLAVLFDKIASGHLLLGLLS